MLLDQALVELLNEKPIGEISVKEIAAKADINRSTYYSHYVDIYDQLDHITERTMSEHPFAEGRLSPTKQEIEASLAHMRENRLTYIALLKTGRYHEYLVSKAMKIFDEGTLQKGRMLHADREVYRSAVIYSVCGTENLLLDWLEKDKLDAETLTNLMSDINASIERAVLKTHRG